MRFTFTPWRRVRRCPPRGLSRVAKPHRLRLLPTLALLAGVCQAADAPLYKVVDGYKVDPKTMEGFRTWRAAACE